MKKINPAIFISICISILMGIIIGYLSRTIMHEDTQSPREEETTSVRQSGYEYINPLLECETKTYGNNQKYIPFEKDLIKKIELIQKSHPDIHLSVYFRNLRNGPWFGINEDADFSPASLMKLPILIMYLKWAEYDPSVLKKILVPSSNNTMNQVFTPTNPVKVWSDYSVEELLYHLIIHSDNVASNTLIENIPVDHQAKVFTDLNIPLPTDINYAISVKEYASFFRILYNASYLSREYSEVALNLLSQSIFTGWITGKIPDTIPVAHKFGEREMLDENGKTINQLHDCGIVYYEPYPYLVCIMSRGNTDMNTLSTILQDSSKTIYDEVSNKYPVNIIQ